MYAIQVFVRDIFFYCIFSQIKMCRGRKLFVVLTSYILLLFAIRTKAFTHNIVCKEVLFVTSNTNGLSGFHYFFSYSQVFIAYTSVFAMFLCFYFEF
ncbi:hypothetical protein GLYMA_03G064500v4 [Glycine max]|nr:hypothetical protein GYH30_006409 [Glycine max]KRH65826.2 hypothetical protein GLYMA_03G064500v4 [Glycine max]